MRFGKHRFGQSRFGASSVSATVESRLEVAADSTVSSLSTAVTASSSMAMRSTGAPTALAATPTVPDRTIEMASTAGITALATGPTPLDTHLTIGGAGRVADTILTIEAKYPELIATVSPERDIPERDRIEGYLKRPFETEFPARQSGGVHGPGEFSSLVDLFGDITDQTNGAKNDVLGARMIDIAYGQSLDNIGSLLLLPRLTGETDPHYRIRLKSHARALTGEATVDQVRETLAILLECDVADIGLSEPTDQPAQFDLTVDGTIIEAASVTVDDVVGFVKRFRAGGVKVTLSVTGSFTYRSIEDFNAGTDLGEKGYGEAGYSGRIL